MTTAKVQGPYSNWGTAQPTLYLTLGSVPVAVDILVVTFIGENAGGCYELLGISDANGKVSWARASQYCAYGGYEALVYMDIEVWVGLVQSGASKTQNLNVGPEYSFEAATIYEFSGASNTVDQVGPGAYGYNNPLDTSTTPSTGQDGELVVGALFQDVQSTFSNPTSGYTLTYYYVRTVGALGTVYKLNASQGAQDCTVTGGNTKDWVGTIATFKPSVVSVAVTRGDGLFWIVSALRKKPERVPFHPRSVSVPFKPRSLNVPFKPRRF
jgi:hypothetical protein